MRKMKDNSRRCAALLALGTLASGMLNVSFCSAIDIKHNIVSGTMDFIAGYAEDFLATLIPAPDELIPQDGE